MFLNVQLQLVHTCMHALILYAVCEWRNLFFCECFPKRQFHAFIFHLYSSPSHPALYLRTSTAAPRASSGRAHDDPSPQRKSSQLLSIINISREFTLTIWRKIVNEKFSFHFTQSSTYSRCLFDDVSTKMRKIFRHCSTPVSNTNDDDPKNCRQLFALVTRSPMMLFFLSDLRWDF